MCSSADPGLCDPAWASSTKSWQPLKTNFRTSKSRRQLAATGFDIQVFSGLGVRIRPQCAVHSLIAEGRGWSDTSLPLHRFLELRHCAKGPADRKQCGEAGFDHSACNWGSHLAEGMLAKSSQAHQLLTRPASHTSWPNSPFLPFFHSKRLHLDTRQLLVYCLASFSGMLTFGLSWNNKRATTLLPLQSFKLASYQ